MKDGLDLQFNKPRRITRVSDLIIIDYFQTVLSSKQALRNPPVLFKKVGRSLGNLTRYLPQAQRVAYTL